MRPWGGGGGLGLGLGVAGRVWTFFLSVNFTAAFGIPVGRLGVGQGSGSGYIGSNPNSGDVCPTHFTFLEGNLLKFVGTTQHDPAPSEQEMGALLCIFRKVCMGSSHGPWGPVSVGNRTRLPSHGGVG